MEYQQLKKELDSIRIIEWGKQFNVHEWITYLGHEWKHHACSV